MLPFFTIQEMVLYAPKNQYFCTKYFNESVLNLIYHNLAKPNLTYPTTYEPSTYIPKTYLTVTYTLKTYQLLWCSAIIAITLSYHYFVPKYQFWDIKVLLPMGILLSTYFLNA